MHLKVKWSSSKIREKALNADFTFQPNTKIYFASPEEVKVAPDEFSETELEATSHY